MTDRTLLELAAKAAGIKWFPGADGNIYTGTIEGMCVWNPLIDDGDALRLAVKLRLDIALIANVDNVLIYKDDEHLPSVEEQFNGDPYAATRRAIVRAAAEIGKTK